MRLDRAFVRYWGDRYVEEELGDLEHELLTKTRADIAQRGYLTPDELTKIATWKSPRVLGVLERDGKTIADATGLAFAQATPEWMRHHILRILKGVDHAMASAILTVWDPKTHTVVDYRAVEALQELSKRRALELEPPPGRRGALPGYWTYLKAYRPIAASIGVDHRDLDRALWKWHKAGMPERWPGCE
jgi:hypothetical protein